MADELTLFVAFYWADNRTGTKSPEQVEWFVERLRDRGFEVDLPVIRS